ncbi:DUF6931 family protein [Tropicimonas sp.]|uniref:DUF6931 family protein n=1 Tax=Tropicimonas sp. TaxID=2067044 RepID=UPI003A88F1B6
MGERFEGLRKIPQEPAARLLAGANVRLQTPLRGPATATVSAVLSELDRIGAFVDMLRLLSVALPPRERTWWACLAGRDLLGPQIDPLPRALAMAEAWVFRPSEETRAAAQAAAEAADSDDDTAMCATIAVMSEGSLGTGAMQGYEAPPGAAANMAFGINIMALDALGEDIEASADLLIDRALDIARGGNGRIARPFGGPA